MQKEDKKHIVRIKKIIILGGFTLEAVGENAGQASIIHH